MRKELTACLLITATCVSLSAMAETKEEALEKIGKAANAGLEDVTNIQLVTETMGWSTMEYYEKTSWFEHDGVKYYVMRNVPISELQERQSPDNPLTNATPGDIQRAAETIEQQGERMERAALGAMEDSELSGLAGGTIASMLRNPPADKPWLSANPRDMTGMYVTFLNAAAKAKIERASENPEADARSQLAQQEQALANARLVRSDPINGRPTFGIFTDNINMQQADGDHDVTINSAVLTYDAEKYVPLRMRMEGVMRADGESRDIFIQRDDTDYRTVPGCGELYRPFRSVMSMGGVLSPKEQAQMKEAGEKMAEFEKQMASMPASQRAMMEKMMGPQMEMIKKMMSSGAIEVESKVIEMRCNGGIPDALDIAVTTFGGGGE